MAPRLNPAQQVAASAQSLAVSAQSLAVSAQSLVEAPGAQRSLSHLARRQGMLKLCSSRSHRHYRREQGTR